MESLHVIDLCSILRPKQPVNSWNVNKMELNQRVTCLFTIVYSMYAEMRMHSSTYILGRVPVWQDEQSRGHVWESRQPKTGTLKKPMKEVSTPGKESNNQL